MNQFSPLKIFDGSATFRDTIAVEVDAMHVSSRQALAGLLERQGRTDEAVELMEALLKIEPGHPTALSTIGRLRLSDPEAARPFLEEVCRKRMPQGVCRKAPRSRCGLKASPNRFLDGSPRQSPRDWCRRCRATSPPIPVPRALCREIPHR